MNCLIVVFALLPSVYLNNEADVVRGHGNFFVNGIFPITRNDSGYNEIDMQSGVMMAEAMRFAVNKVNNLNDYLYGYKLKIKTIYDSSDEKKVREDVFKTYSSAVGFLVGPYSSETSYLSSILTDTFSLIGLSYSATYADFGRFGVVQDYMYRSVPSDEYRILAVLNFIKEVHWNYIGVISSHGYDGERDAMNFISKLSENGVCLSNQQNLPKFKNEGERYDDALQQMKTDKRLKALVLFTTDEDSKYIFSGLKKYGLQDRFQILCVYGCMNHVGVIDGNEEIANNTLSLHLYNPPVPEFKNYYFSRKPSDKKVNDYFDNFWENLFQCTLNSSNKNLYSESCSGKEALSEEKGYYQQTPVHTVIDTVFNLAKALRIFIFQFCNTAIYDYYNLNKTKCQIEANDTHLLTEKMQEIVFKQLIFDDGTFKTKESGKLDTDNKPFESTIVRYDVHHYRYFGEKKSRTDLVWKWECIRENDTEVNEVEKEQLFTAEWVTSNHYEFEDIGTCSATCQPGYFREYDQNHLNSKCCWTCRSCPENNKVSNNTCILCRKTEKVDELLLNCLPLPIKGISWRNSIISIIFVLFSVLGLCLTGSMVAVFTIFNNNRIVRASGRDLCYMILVGISLTFVCPFAFLVKTTQLTCILRGAFPGFAFLTCYVPLFLKTNRIYRIFFSARVSVTRPSLVSSQSQFGAMFGVLAVQLIISIVWFSSQTPLPEVTVSEDGSYGTMHCSSDANPILLILNLSLSVFFMVCCTVLAFKTRRFPKNYNEAKYIGLTLYITCVCWAVFLPTFFLAPSMESEFLGEYLMCVVCILIGFVTLFGMFGPKIIMIYQSPPTSSSQGSLPTWYVTGNLSKDNSKDGCENGNGEALSLNPIAETDEYENAKL